MKVNKESTSTSPLWLFNIVLLRRFFLSDILIRESEQRKHMHLSLMTLQHSCFGVFLSQISQLVKAESTCTSHLLLFNIVLLRSFFSQISWLVKVKAESTCTYFSLMTLQHCSTAEFFLSLSDILISESEQRKHKHFSLMTLQHCCFRVFSLRYLN